MTVTEQFAITLACIKAELKQIQETQKYRKQLAANPPPPPLPRGILDIITKPENISYWTGQEHALLNLLEVMRSRLHYTYEEFYKMLEEQEIST